MKKTTFAILCLEGAVLSFNVAAAAALVPSIAADFSVSQFWAGRIVWLYMLPYGAAALFYGPLVRRFDARRVELTCLFAFSCSNLLAALSAGMLVLSLARFLMGVFGASVIPLALILISRQVQEKNRGRHVGIFFGSTFFSSLVGLGLSGIVHWRVIFFIPAIFGLLLWVHMYFYLPSFREERHGLRVRYVAACRDRQFVSLFVYIFLVSLMYHAVQQWLAVYFSGRFGLGQFAVSMLLTLTSLSGIFGEVFGGWLSDISGRATVINAGVALMVFAVFLLLFNLPLVLLALVMVVWGAGWTFNHAGVSSLLTELPAEFLNEAASFNSSIRFLSGGLGALLGGVLLEKSYLLSFNVFGYGLILLAFFSRRWRVFSPAKEG